MFAVLWMTALPFIDRFDAADIRLEMFFFNVTDDDSNYKNVSVLASTLK